MFATRFLIVAAAFGTALLAGCSDTKAPSTQGGKSTPVTNPTSTKPTTPSATDEVAVERAKLSPADRALVEAQEWCVISTEAQLGSMGPPIKLDIKGQPVFVCCKSCQKKAESDPDKTLATLAAHKAKKSGTTPAAPEKKNEKKEETKGK